MTGFLVKGFSGRKPLRGELGVMGAKNSVLKAQAASLLFKEGILLRNVPLIADVMMMNKLLEKLGVQIKQSDERSFDLKAPAHLDTELDEETAKLFRSSIVLAGPILAREGRVSFTHPGGCVIGERPVDVFLDSFQKLGATIKRENGFYVLTAKKLKGAEIFFKLPSVTATETLMMTAVLVNGTTVLYNCACEPEIVYLADFLNFSGAKISGAGTSTIVVSGGDLLEKGVFDTPPDRIEAGCFAIIAALCGKDLKIKGCNPMDMQATLFALEETGVKVTRAKDYVIINAPRLLKAVNIKTREYPGFSTDLQAPFSIILTQAEGRSLIFETVFEGRLNYLLDLERMGANIVLCDPHRAIITGRTKLRGRNMESPDLRAGLSFLIACMVAEGDSMVSNAYNIDRGYEKIEDRLNAIGADIKRV